MEKLEAIFRETCEMNMPGFDFDKFKKEYPKLFNCIIGSMLSSLVSGSTNKDYLSKANIKTRLKQVN